MNVAEAGVRLTDQPPLSGDAEVARDLAQLALRPDTVVDIAESPVTSVARLANAHTVALVQIAKDAALIQEMEAAVKGLGRKAEDYDELRLATVDTGELLYILQRSFLDLLGSVNEALDLRTAKNMKRVLTEAAPCPP